MLVLALCEAVPSMTLRDAWLLPYDYAIDLLSARRAMLSRSAGPAGPAEAAEAEEPVVVTLADGSRRRVPPGVLALRRKMGW